MAEKRTATCDLNHENWDKEEAPEHAGTFRAASSDELKNRVIKKARRKMTTDKNENDKDKSVFKSFQGFGNVSTASTATVTSTGSPFSFLSKISSTSSTKTSLDESDAITPESKSSSSEKSSKYHSMLKGLNQAVCNWIKQHIDDEPICILTPIFKDYEKHLKKIQEEEKVIVESISDIKNKEETKATNSFSTDYEFSGASAVTTSSSKSKPISFGIKDDNKTDSFGSKNKNIFGASPIQENKKPDQTSGLFANIKPTTTNISSGFKFGTSASDGQSVTTSTTGFSFSSTKPFSFGSSVTTTASSSTDGNNKQTEENDEDDMPPKVEFKAVVEEDSVYSKRCKVFVKHDGNFADRGVGMLYLKPANDKTQLLVRADTNLGNILLNFILSDGIPSQRMGKNNVMVVCIPTPESEQKPTSVLLRVKTGEEADELLETINKYKK